MKVAYLASPYAHPDPQVKKKRHETVTRAAFLLFQKGIMVYSPLTHNIPIDQLGFEGSWEAWRDFDLTMLSKCDSLLVLKLEGWDISRGVTAEIAHAKELDLPIEWLEPEELELIKPRLIQPVLI